MARLDSAGVQAMFCLIDIDASPVAGRTRNSKEQSDAFDEQQKAKPWSPIHIDVQQSHAEKSTSNASGFDDRREVQHATNKTTVIKCP